MAKKKILFLAANPKGTSRLRLDEEVREIEAGLLRSQHRQEFELVQKWAVRPQDIRRALLDESPNIIHFSGHGESSGQVGRNASGTRDLGPLEETTNRAAHLIFEDDQGNPKPIEPTALANLFKLFADQLDCVVLNACYSQDQANAIAEFVPYVVGTKKAIGDRAAIEFAKGFYDGLGAGRSIDFAFQLGRSAIETDGLNEHLTPVLVKGSRPARPILQTSALTGEANPITLTINGPETIALGQTAYFTILSQGAIRGVWSIGGFNNNQPTEVTTLSPSHQIYVEPTNPSRVRDSFTLVFTAYDAQGNSAMAAKEFAVTPASPSQPTVAKGSQAPARRSRGQLFKGLSNLPGPQFEHIVFVLNPPAGNVPGPAASQAHRLAALLEWAESDLGPGLGAVEAELDEVLGNPR